MSSLLQNPLSNSSSRIKFHFPSSISSPRFNGSKTLKISLSYNQFNRLSAQSSLKKSYPLEGNPCLVRNPSWAIKAYDSSAAAFDEYERSIKQFKFDAFLSFVESLCVISSVVISVGCIANWVFFKQQNSGLVAMGNKMLVVLLAMAVAVGSVIRRRQWRRVCGFPTSKSELDSGNGNVIERIEKLEEGMKSATTIIRMLSRQLEKLGIRFRLHRKALKEPISETAALAQKNSEVARALAEREDILEKELAEVQKVLLAMQDQQQKQLELILAIAESGNLIDTKQEAPSQRSIPNEKDTVDKGLKQVDGQQIQSISGQIVASNDIAL